MFKSITLYGSLQGRYLRPYWPLVLLLAVLLFASTALQIVLPQIVRHFIDTAQEGGALRALYMSALTYLALGLGAQLLDAFVLYFGRDVAWRATNRLRSDLTVHVLKLDMGFHGAHRPGELLERIDGDIHRLANFFSQFFIQDSGRPAAAGGHGRGDLAGGLAPRTGRTRLLHLLPARADAAIQVHDAAMAGREQGARGPLRRPGRAYLR